MGFCGVKEREVEEERAWVVVESLREGRKGVLRRPENHPRREELGRLVRGWSGRSRWEGMDRKEVMVAVSNIGVVSSVEEGYPEVEAEEGSSERDKGVEMVTWPKSRP